jgi:hypothetical protein
VWSAREVDPCRRRGRRLPDDRPLQRHDRRLQHQQRDDQRQGQERRRGDRDGDAYQQFDQGRIAAPDSLRLAACPPADFRAGTRQGAPSELGQGSGACGDDPRSSDAVSLVGGGGERVVTSSASLGGPARAAQLVARDFGEGVRCRREGPTRSRRYFCQLPNIEGELKVRLSADDTSYELIPRTVHRTVATESSAGIRSHESEIRKRKISSEIQGLGPHADHLARPSPCVWHLPGSQRLRLRCHRRVVRLGRQKDDEAVPALPSWWVGA